MTNATDMAKAEVQAALLYLLRSGVSLTKIRIEPLCREFQLSCKKDKAAMLIEEILEDAGVKELLIKYLVDQTNEEMVAGMASRKHALDKKPRRTKPAQKKAQEPELGEGISASSGAPRSKENRQVEYPESSPPDLRLVREPTDQGVTGEPVAVDQTERSTIPYERRPNLKQVYPGPAPSKQNDNGSSLDEAMADMTNAFHIFATEEPSLADVKAVTRYLRSATKLAQARAAS